MNQNRMKQAQALENMEMEDELSARELEEIAGGKISLHIRMWPRVTEKPHGEGPRPNWNPFSTLLPRVPAGHGRAKAF